MPIAINVDEDFGSFGGLPDFTNMDGVPQHNLMLDPKPAPPVSISDVTRGQLGTLTQNVLDSLLGMKGTTMYSRLPSSSTSTSTPSVRTDPSNDSTPLLYAEKSLPNTTTAASSSRSARQQRQEDIIKRAKERRAEVQAELDVVKRRLWETTIERAGLLLIASGQGDGGGECVE